VTPIVWMAGAGVLSWLAIATLVGDEANPEALFGMLAPVVAASATWVAVVRTHAAAPEKLTGVLMAGFALKMIFFGVYVGVMLGPMNVNARPFVASFTGFFIAMYAMEALFLKRLLTDAGRSPRRESD
jgi:hypothetical protein